jgi:nitrate/nitrite transporter NarK
MEKYFKEVNESYYLGRKKGVAMGIFAGGNIFIN